MYRYMAADPAERLLLDEIVLQAEQFQRLRDEDLATLIINRLGEAIDGGK